MGNSSTGIRGIIRKSLAAIIAGASFVALAACGSTSSSSSALQSVKDKGEIVFGTEGVYSPFSYHDSSSDKLTGYDVEVATAIAKQLGVKAKFVEGNFDTLLAGVDSKKFDTVANQISATDERKAKYDFSNPYTYSYGVVVTKKDDNSVKSFEDIKGKKAAETLTSNWNKTAQQYGATTVQVNEFSQAVDTLVAGRADVIVNDGLAVLDYLKQHPDADIKVAYKSDKTPAAQLPFRKGSDDLVKAVNDAIAKLQSDGTLTKISEKYFGEDFSSK